MNERAFDFALEVLKDNPTLETWTFTRTELERFAEMIVKDCAQLVKDAHYPGGGTYLHQLYTKYNIKYDWQK